MLLHVDFILVNSWRLYELIRGQVLFCENFVGCVASMHAWLDGLFHSLVGGENACEGKGLFAIEVCVGYSRPILVSILVPNRHWWWERGELAHTFASPKSVRTTQTIESRDLWGECVNQQLWDTTQTVIVISMGEVFRESKTLIAKRRYPKRAKPKEISRTGIEPVTDGFQ